MKRQLSSLNHPSIQETLYFKLSNAIKQNNKQLVIEYLTEGANPNFVPSHTLMPISVLARAVDNNNYDIVKILMEAGAKPNYISAFGSAITHAARSEISIEILKLLLHHESAKRDLNNYSNVVNPLTIALKFGELEKLKILIDAGSSYSNKMVHKVAYYGFIDILDYLIDEKGLDIDYQANGKNALSIAVEHREFNMAKHCITKGINIHAKLHGETILEKVLSNFIIVGRRVVYGPEDIRFLESLLKAGSNPYELNAQSFDILNKVKNAAIDNIIEYNKACYEMNLDAIKDNFDESLTNNILQREKLKTFKDFSSRAQYDLHVKNIRFLKQVLSNNNEPTEVMSLKDRAKWYIHDNIPQIFNFESLSEQLPKSLTLEMKNDFVYVIGDN